MQPNVALPSRTVLQYYQYDTEENVNAFFYNIILQQWFIAEIVENVFWQVLHKQSHCIFIIENSRNWNILRDSVVAQNSLFVLEKFVQGFYHLLVKQFPGCTITYTETLGFEGNVVEHVFAVDWS